MSFDNYNVEKLKIDDYYNGYLELLEELTIVESDKISFEDFSKRFNEIKSKIYIIKNKNNKIIASGSIFIEKKFIHKLGSVGHIEDIIVSKNYRNLGLGKTIINKLIEYSKQKNCYKVILDCSENNKLFYEKCGFIIKGVEMSKYF